MNKKTNISEKDKLLTFALESGIIDLDDVKAVMNKKQKENILKNHPYDIWQGKDGRWRTYIFDSTQKYNRKMIVKSTKEKVHEALFQHYEDSTETAKDPGDTLQTLYPRWLEYKGMHTQAETYVSRIASDWKKYYLDTDIIKVPIKKLDKLTLDNWAHKLIKDHDMSKTQYYNSTVIMRQALEYAVDLGIIKSNPFSLVKIDGKRMFRKVRKKPDATQVFFKEESTTIANMAWEQFHNPTSQFQLAPLALLFQFQTGLRIGELCAVRYEDIETPNYIHIQRMLNKDTKKVVEHTKTDCGDRQVILTATAKKIIQCAKDRQKELGVATDGYIFSLDHQPLPQYAVAYLYRKYCKEAGIMQKSSHKVRKTYISTLLDEHVNINTIREMVGHADERTTLGNYCFDRKTEDEKRNQIEMALS